MGDFPEPAARDIFERAIEEQRCAEVLECLFAGGSVTVDANTDKLALATAEQLAAMLARGDEGGGHAG